MAQKFLKDDPSVKTEYENFDSETTALSNPSYDALAKAKSEQNYKSYYNTAIQLANAESNAKKYLNNQLANQGMLGQGYGSSANAGVLNAYANAFAQNRSDYGSNELNIAAENQERVDAANTERDNQLVTFISDYSNGDKDTINKFMQNYGYMDADGNYTDQWNNMDPTRQAYITSIMDTMGVNDIGTANKNGIYKSVNDIGNVNIANNKGEKSTIAKEYSKAYEQLVKNYDADKYLTGTVVKLSSDITLTPYTYANKTYSAKVINLEDDVYVEITEDGLKLVDKKTYNKSKYKKSLTGE